MQDDIFLKKSTEVADNLLEILEVELEELTSKEKELIAAYSFGILAKMAQENSISEELKNSGVKKLFMEVLKCTTKEADELLKRLFGSIQDKSDEGFHIMIYQRKSSYHDYNTENYNEIYNNLTNMIDIVARKEYECY
ncbi:hypothetical protein FC789_05595 [Clostridium botulinum]|nr:hypothetical protein [Clostridium botulinum]